MLVAFLSALLYGLNNLQRGGGVLMNVIKGTQLRRVFYILFGWLLICLNPVGLSVWASLGVAFLLFVPFMVGTGRPMNALVGREKKELEEFLPFDVVAAFVAGLLYDEKLENKQYQQAWAITWFTIPWGAVALSLIPVLGLSSLLIGLYGFGVYFGWRIGEKFKMFQTSHGWRGAEVLGGTLLGLGVFL